MNVIEKEKMQCLNIEIKLKEMNPNTYLVDLNRDSNDWYFNYFIIVI